MRGKGKAPTTGIKQHLTLLLHDRISPRTSPQQSAHLHYNRGLLRDLLQRPKALAFSSRPAGAPRNSTGFFAVNSQPYSHTSTQPPQDSRQFLMRQTPLACGGSSIHCHMSSCRRLGGPTTSSMTPTPLQSSIKKIFLAKRSRAPGSEPSPSFLVGSFPHRSMF